MVVAEKGTYHRQYIVTAIRLLVEHKLRFAPQVPMSQLTIFILIHFVTACRRNRQNSTDIIQFNLQQHET